MGDVLSTEKGSINDADWILTHGLRFSIRDMGNGVDRLEAAELVPIDQAKAEAVLPGREPIPLPLPARLIDMYQAARSALGLDDDKRALVASAFAHAVDEHCLEFLLWRLL